jgi:hypothetical protein
MGDAATDEWQRDLMPSYFYASTAFLCFDFFSLDRPLLK